MKVLYIETSAILAWLFSEPNSQIALEQIDQSDLIVSSTLSLLETERVILRAINQNLLDSDEGRKLRDLFTETTTSWALIEITKEIREGASQSFPVEPVRSLDAIHLSTALEFLRIYPEMNVLSFDKRINDNIPLLGLSFSIESQATHVG
ncbi:MAG: type II toxin-antitoxin system VapC family toxin [bacterium]|nr:type II toxin-antitoxin system VapC family toxin [bacterium]